MVIRWPANRTLAKICVYGGFFCVSSAMFMSYKLKDRIRQTEYFREAFKILRAHPGAIQYLGEPIKEAGFDLTKTGKYFKGGRIEEFEVNTRGSKDKGKMFFWGERENEVWNITRVELELKSKPDQRLVIKKNV